MPVLDSGNLAVNILELLAIGRLTALLIWVFQNGILQILRSLSFFIDKRIIGIMGSIYNIFDKLLTGKMFNDEIIREVMQNVYVFIGVLVFFRLVMLLLKYLINPELTSDDKAGVNSLVKRVLLGSMGILFIPQLFTLMNSFQAAVLEDSLIQQIVIPTSLVEKTSELHKSGGKHIGTYVLSGFLNPNPNASSDSKQRYEKAVAQGDLGMIDLNKGMGIMVDGNYEYEYIIIVSTLVLGYTLFLLLQYALDVAVRFFKLFFYQIIAPIAMVEYMIDGADNGMFASWRKAVMGTYFMLFTRILSIWFVVFVMALMSDSGGASAGTLLADKDFLLRAIIIIAALGFMKDLPKLVGELFGLDFEQASSASEISNSVKGMVKGAGALGLGAAGAVAGAGASIAKGGLNKANIKSSLGAAGRTIGSNVMGSTNAGKALMGGYSNTTGTIKKSQDKAELSQAVAQKRAVMNEASQKGGAETTAERTIRAIQEVELRVAGEKLSDANRANTSYSHASPSIMDQAKSAAGGLSIGYRARLEGMDIPALELEAVTVGTQLNEAINSATESARGGSQAEIASSVTRAAFAGGTGTVDTQNLDEMEKIASQYNSRGIDVDPVQMRSEIQAYMTANTKAADLSSLDLQNVAVGDIESFLGSTSARQVSQEFELTREAVQNTVISNVKQAGSSVTMGDNIGDMRVDLGEANVMAEQQVNVTRSIKTDTSSMSTDMGNIQSNVGDMRVDLGEVRVSAEQTADVVSNIQTDTSSMSTDVGDIQSDVGDMSVDLGEVRVSAEQTVEQTTEINQTSTSTGNTVNEINDSIQNSLNPHGPSRTPPPRPNNQNNPGGPNNN